MAVQIGVAIAARKKVIYFDFELSDKQFESRYSNNFLNHYNFPANFLRAEINPDEADYNDAGFNNAFEFINASVETALKETGAKILIIDNITYLRHETEKAKDALPLMKDLIALKKKYGLSILVIAHTPKRNLSQPISVNDLQGSKMLMNFCDSAFALGESTQGKNIRYLKQIKVRYTEKIYSSENVAVFQISKPENFLAFTPFEDVHGPQGVYTTCEHEHLKQYSKEDKEEIKAKVIELNNKGYSQRKIKKELRIGLGTVNKYLNETGK